MIKNINIENRVNKYTKESETYITMTMDIDGREYTGEAKMIWREKQTENDYDAHWATLIYVPFQNIREENLMIFEKDRLDDAIEKAKMYLEYFLSDCMICR